MEKGKQSESSRKNKVHIRNMIHYTGRCRQKSKTNCHHVIRGLWKHAEIGFSL